jgi:hypothetical protein
MSDDAMPHLRPLALAVGASASLLLWVTGARACGASGGSVGASACSLSEHEEAIRKKWRVGASFGATWTALRFSGETTFDTTRSLALASVAYQPTRSWTFELAAGPLIGGHLETAGTRFDFEPGLVTAAGASYLVLDAAGARPFVLTTAQLAFVTTSTQETGTAGAPTARYDAFDLRLGGVVGWRLWNVVSPYALARVFGGPVFWTYQGQDVTGTDTHHYQLGAGLLVSIARRVDVFAEGVPLGERGVTAGAGVAF